MVTARVERRLAAILAADVAGYSRLMERDEAGTLARLKALRKELIEPLLAEHRDRVDDAGELAERAVAHELDDAAAVLGDERLDQLLPVRLQSGERAGLVALHKP